MLRWYHRVMYRIQKWRSMRLFARAQTLSLRAYRHARRTGDPLFQ